MLIINVAIGKNTLQHLLMLRNVLRTHPPLALPPPCSQVRTCTQLVS